MKIKQELISELDKIVAHTWSSELVLYKHEND